MSRNAMDKRIDDKKSSSFSFIKDLFFKIGIYEVPSIQADIVASKKQEQNFIFVLDQSGTMREAMPTLQEGVIEALQQFFKPDCKLDSFVSFIVFNHNARLLRFPNNKSRIKITKETLPKITGLIKGISAGGDSNIEEALELLFNVIPKDEFKKTTVVLLTDGDDTRASSIGLVKFIKRQPQIPQCVLLSLGQYGNKHILTCLSKVLVRDGRYHHCDTAQQLKEHLLTVFENKVKPSILSSLDKEHDVTEEIEQTGDMKSSGAQL